MKTKDMTGLTPSAIVKLLEHCVYKCDPPQPLLIKSPPGCGKSMITNAFGKEHGLQVKDTRAYHYNPVDWRGVPAADLQRRVTSFLPPDFLPLEELTGTDELIEALVDDTGDDVFEKEGRKVRRRKGILWFFDEIDKAPPAVQAPLLEILLDRRVCGRPIRRGVAFVAAANRAEDRSMSYDLSAAIRNRVTIVNMRVDVNEWLEWAFSASLAHEVISFIRAQGDDLLFHFEPDGHPEGFPTPRSWEVISRFLVGGLTPIDEHIPMFAGSVGAGAAKQFVTFCQVYQQIPSAEAVIVGGDTSIVAPAGRPDHMFAFSNALVGHTSRAPQEKRLEYAQRLLRYIVKPTFPREFATHVYSSYAKSEAKKSLGFALTKTDEFGVFAEKFEFVVAGSGGAKKRS